MESHEQRYLKAPTVYHFTPDAALLSCSWFWKRDRPCSAEVTKLPAVAIKPAYDSFSYCL